MTNTPTKTIEEGETLVGDIKKAGDKVKHGGEKVVDALVAPLHTSSENKHTKDASQSDDIEITPEERMELAKFA